MTPALNADRRGSAGGVGASDVARVPLTQAH